MCFSQRSSLIAWVISFFIAIYLIYRNKNFDRWNAAFILSFSVIQLLEAQIWKNPKENNSTYAKLILIGLYLQPLVQNLAGYLSTKHQILKYAVILYLVLFAYAIYRTTREEFYTTIGPNGHIVWNSKGDSFMGSTGVGILYLIGMFLPLLFILPSSLPLIAIGSITLLWSIINSGTGEIGSLWCYTAVAYSITCLFM